MNKIAPDNNETVMEALEKYADMVRRICYLHLRNYSDVEDVFQEVFLKLLQSKTDFNDDEHTKAWLCRVTINQCKDVCKSFFRKNVCSIEEMELPFQDQRETGIMSAVLSLPQKYKDVIYLYYYEEYTVPQMAKLLNKKENSIYSNLFRARKLLKSQLGGSGYEIND